MRTIPLQAQQKAAAQPAGGPSVTLPVKPQAAAASVALPVSGYYGAQHKRGGCGNTYLHTQLLQARL